MPGHFVLICDLGINPAQASLRIGTVNMLVRNPEEEKKEKEKVCRLVSDLDHRNLESRWRSHSRTARRVGMTTLWEIARSSPSTSISYIRPSGQKTHVFRVSSKISTNQKHLGNLQGPPKLHNDGGLQALQGRRHRPRDFLWEYHLWYLRHILNKKLIFICQNVRRLRKPWWRLGILQSLQSSMTRPSQRWAAKTY